MKRSLDSKLAVVTGVTSGIGLATTARLVAEGARVLGLARDSEKLEALRQRFGAAFTPVPVDLSMADQRRHAAEQLRATGRPFDVFISNAAECVYASALGLPGAALSRLFEVNVAAVIDLCQVVVPLMRQGAQIVQLSSVTARHMPNPKFAPYSATKVAVEHFVEALRLELAPRQIQVSVVAPGLVDTPIYDKVEGFERTRQKLHEQVPVWLDADDVAETILWVLSRPAHVVVSEVVVVPSAQAR